MRIARLLTISICCSSLLVAFAFAQEAEPPAAAVKLADVNLDETKLRVHFTTVDSHRWLSWTLLVDSRSQARGSA